MSWIKHVVVLGVQTFLWTLCGADTEVSCVYNESCILPCSFQPGDELVLHWIQMTPGDPHAHSYYFNQDQLKYQNQNFRSRTSLFKDQISRGNASLQLTGVKVQDQGRYKCFSSTTRGTEESFIILRVDAPVRTVDIQQEGNRISCSSQGIYPEPGLTWSTTPPSNISLQNSTTVQQTEQQLYTISSSLTLSDRHTDLTHSCTVTTRSSSRRARIQSASIHGSDSETTICCSASNISLYHLIWTFNHSQTILTKTRTGIKDTVSEEWRLHVKSVSESGCLTLQLLSSNQEGLYTCDLTDEQETIRTNNLVRITGDSKYVGGITAIVLVVILLSAAAGVVIYCKKIKGQRQEEVMRTGSGNEETTQETQLRDREQSDTHRPNSSAFLLQSDWCG